MQHVSVMVIVPISPNTSTKFIEDTAASYAHYAITDFKIILSDDAQQGMREVVKITSPDCDVVLKKADKRLGRLVCYAGKCFCLCYKI